MEIDPDEKDMVLSNSNETIPDYVTFRVLNVNFGTNIYNLYEMSKVKNRL